MVEYYKVLLHSYYICHHREKKWLGESGEDNFEDTDFIVPKGTLEWVTNERLHDNAILKLNEVVLSIFTFSD